MLLSNGTPSSKGARRPRRRRRRRRPRRPLRPERRGHRRCPIALAAAPEEDGRSHPGRRREPVK